MNPNVVHPNDPPHLKAAFSKLGLSEIPGARNEKQVLEMYKAAGHPEISDDETAWCAAFVGWCLKKAGLPNTGSLMARSYVKYGVGVSLKDQVPRGAIIVWPRGRPPSGHVNICLHDDGTYLTCIGGNQGNGNGGGVTISRERKSHALAARSVGGSPVALVDPEPTDEEAVDLSAKSKPGLLRRIANWGATFSGFGFLAYLTDWQIAAIIFGFAFIVLVCATGFFLWLFGKERVRAWFSRNLA